MPENNQPNSDGAAPAADRVGATADKMRAPARAESSAKVLAAEYGLIWSDKPQPAGETDTQLVADYHVKAFANGQAALCLSGGGIRSAAFALGVLQALSRKQILTGFHYLSTVSGGGYIGGWLQRWIAEPDSSARSVMDELAGSREPAQVSALRENSNFITPKVGFQSNDTWTALAISIRNIGINWLLFGPLFLLVALVPNFFASGLTTLPRNLPQLDWLYYSEVAICGALTGFAAFHLCRALPSYGREGSAQGRAAEHWVRWHVVIPLVLASALGSFVLACDLFWQPHVYVAGFLLAAVNAAGLLAGLLVGGLTLAPGHRMIFLRDIPFWLLATIGAAATIQLGSQILPVDLSVPLVVSAPAAGPPSARASPAGAPAARGAPTAAATGKQPVAAADGKNAVARQSPEEERATRWRSAVLAMLAPILLLWAQISAVTVFAAFRAGRSKGIQTDSDREWLARLTALEMKPILFWALASFSTLLLFELLRAWVPGFDLSISGIVALVSGAAAVAGGRSGHSGIAAGAGGRLLRYLPLQGLIALATFVFAVALLMVMSHAELGLAGKIGALIAKWVTLPSWLSPMGTGHILLATILIGLLLFFGRAIRVNRFSLNGLYRNRLARAFLGGARKTRAAQPFTGFDPFDNIRMHHLKPQVGDRHVLYPIVNVALNVTASEKLAWQERRAEPFIFSPGYSGSAMLRAHDQADERSGAYVSSKIYGGNEPDLGMDGQGISLATAISISGAAASPNMGYHSSAATAFLMTLFNVRLGAWMPNPARCGTLKQDIARADPSNSLRALLSELAGRTDDSGLDIYLSDGGHFENLGLYEMIRRRCRYIVLSDAGADPDCKFEDLGNAVRKIKIDLGIDIRFEELRISSRTRPINPQYAWALGKILYPEGTGHLLYIKPSLFGSLPVDVKSYASRSESFPHETTGDQFFSESQFESYRRLGDFFADELAKKTDDQGNRLDRFADVAAFFAAVEAEHRTEKAGDEEKETRGLLKRVISSLGFGAADDAD
ncbi:MAG TPA: patatin-like phospholipase family protein [Allosphingosinicella sp.]|nr:patatin-like phospholipase family protein [Allosphingosinicella sp.]